MDNDDECIDYNRFTFRNSGDEGNSFSRKKNKRDTKKRKKNRDREEIPIYNEDSSDSDINKNINIDAYKRKCKNNNKIMRKQNKNIEINNYIRNKNIGIVLLNIDYKEIHMKKLIKKVEMMLTK